MSTKKVIIPKSLLDIMLGLYPADLDNIKALAGENRFPTLLRLACSLYDRGHSQAEIWVSVWVRNQERCVPPLDDINIDEIVERAVAGDGTSRLPEREIIKIGDWAIAPGEKRAYYNNQLIYKLHLYQYWVFEILHERRKVGVPKMPQASILNELKEREARFLKRERDRIMSQEIDNDKKMKLLRKLKPKSSRHIRDWAFRSGHSGDKMYGQLIGKEGGDLFINDKYIPDLKKFN